MGCRSDYMDPTQKERLLQETAQLLEYALEAMGEMVPQQVSEAAANQYCTIDLVPALCGLINSMTSSEHVRIVYNARDKKSRRLADWWEKHLEADRAREAKSLSKAVRQESVIRRMWEDTTNSLWPREGDYASTSPENIMNFAKNLLDNDMYKSYVDGGKEK